METWILLTVVVLATGSAVIATLFSERNPLRDLGFRHQPVQPIRPADLRRVRFPLRLRGYDPVLVDRWLTAAADALEVLADTAGRDLVALADEHFLDDGEAIAEPVVRASGADQLPPDGEGGAVSEGAVVTADEDASADEPGLR